jgi:hypothetical protein
MATRREMSKWKKCKTCGAIMRLAFIHGRPCYKHSFPLERVICANRKAKTAAEKEAQKTSG